MADDNDFLSDINNLVSGASGAVPETSAADENTIASVAGAIDESFQDKPSATEPPKVETEKAPADEKTAPAKPDAKKAEAEAKPTTPNKPETADKGKVTPMLDTFLQQDEQNNLVTADGTIIAMAGKSRAFFQKLKEEGRQHREAAMRMAQSQHDLAEKFKELFQEHTNLKTSGANDLTKMTGMSEQELPEAIALLKEYKVNPTKAIKRLLTQARMRGIDLSDIGINGGVDPSIVREAIEAAKQSTNSAKETTPAMTEESAAQAATDFLNRNPAAAEHVEAIANAKRRFPEKSLDQLWLAYQVHLVKMNEQAADEQLTTVVTKQAPIQTRYNRNPQQQKVQAPSLDYGKMSYQEIAASIMKGN